jgi:hypothetical protein
MSRCLFDVSRPVYEKFATPSREVCSDAWHKDILFNCPYRRTPLRPTHCPMSHHTRYRLDRSARSNVVDALTNSNTFVSPPDQIVGEHATELTIRRKQLTTVLNGGLPDDSPWLMEADFFIEQTSIRRRAVQKTLWSALNKLG